MGLETTAMFWASNLRELAAPAVVTAVRLTIWLRQRLHPAEVALERLVRYPRDVGLGVGEPVGRETMKNTHGMSQQKERSVRAAPTGSHSFETSTQCEVPSWRSSLRVEASTSLMLLSCCLAHRRRACPSGGWASPPPPAWPLLQPQEDQEFKRATSDLVTLTALAGSRGRSCSCRTPHSRSRKHSPGCSHS